MAGSKRSGWIVMSVIVLAVTVVGCGAAGKPSEPSPSSTQLTLGPAGNWTRYSGNGVAFDYPRSWRSYPYRWASSFTDSLTYLSTIAVPDPCTTTTTSTGVETDCGQPLSHLRPDDILVSWTEGSGPAPAGFDAVSSQPGMPATFGGRRAKLTRGSGTPLCGQTGAASYISAVIARDVRPSGSTITMTACLGSDGGIAAAAEVMAMLDSVTIA